MRSWGNYHSRHAARTYDLGNLVKRGGRCMRAACDGEGQDCASCNAYILVLAFHPFCSALKNLYDLWDYRC